MDCKICGGSLEESEKGDDRVEWMKRFYKCHDCGATHTRTTVYQAQSCLVAGDDYEIDDTPENREIAWKHIF